jgi:hypothetical protein
MNKYSRIRFLSEMIIGLLALSAGLSFGIKGMAVIALYALTLFIPRHKPDEREVQLYNKIGNITAGATLVACVGIYYFSDFVVNHITIGSNWLTLVVAFFILSHGVSGLTVVTRK